MPFVIDSFPEEETLEGNFQIDPVEEPQDNLIKGYLKSAGKGVLEGLHKFGRIMGPLMSNKSESQIQKELTEALDIAIPQSEESYGQRALRRGLGEAPTMLAFPGSKLSTLPRAIAAGFLGEGAKDLGLPEWAQTAAEVTAYIGPELTKKILEKGSNKEIISSAKKFGLNDQQIAPLIQSEFKQRWLSKLSPKGGRTQRILGETKKSLGEASEALSSRPEAAIELTQPQQQRFLKELGEKGFKIASETRKRVNQDFVDLLRKPITSESMIELYRKLNKTLGTKSKEISMFKTPIKNMISEISPDLGKDFENLNNLFSRYYKIAGRLKPDLVSGLVNAAESMGLFGSFLTGNYLAMKALLAEKGARITAREILLNPRLQQLGEKMLLSINQNKYGIATKIGNQIINQINEKDENLNLPNLKEKEVLRLLRSYNNLD